MRLFWVLILLPLIGMGQKAFPTAFGYGKNASVRSGTTLVLFIDNLNASGPGSALAAFENANPAYIIPRVEGHVALEETVNITAPKFYMGHLAPGDGLLFTFDGATSPQDFLFNSTSDNVILRYLRAYHRDNKADYTSDLKADAFYLSEGQNIIIDHSSFGAANDGSLDIADYGSAPYIENVTIQNCLISNTYSDKAMLIAGLSTHISLYRNYFSLSDNRTPAMGCNSGSCAPNDLLFEVINNVTYWGKQPHRFDPDGPESGLYQENFMYNYHKYKPGISSSARRHILMGDADNYPVSIYARGNIDTYFRTHDGLPDRESTGESASDNTILGDLGELAGSPFDTALLSDGAEILTDATAVWDSISSHVGASLPTRLAFETTMINDFTNATTNGRVTSYTWPTFGSASAPTDTDNDGLPDDVESIYGTNPSLSDSDSDGIDDGNEDHDLDGYPNIEEYAFTALDLAELNQGPIPLTGFSITEATRSIPIGNVSQVSYVFTPSNASDKTGTPTTTNASVATIDGQGNITAVGIGTATVSFTTTDGSFSDSVDVTVTAPPVGSGTTRKRKKILFFF